MEHAPNNNKNTQNNGQKKLCLCNCNNSGIGIGITVDDDDIMVNKLNVACWRRRRKEQRVTEEFIQFIL